MDRSIKKWQLLILCGIAFNVQCLPAYAAPLDPYIEAAKKEGKKASYSSWEEQGNADTRLTEILQAMGMPVVR